VTAQGDVTSEGKSWQMRTFFKGRDRHRIPRTEVTVEWQCVLEHCGGEEKDTILGQQRNQQQQTKEMW
jgi:hypothetical protein